MPAVFKEFEEVRRARGALATRRLGVIQVPVAEIVGSVGRARYFPDGLRPGHGLTPSRVKRLVAALDHGEVLPPVLLYRLGHEYYIVDGHHRVAAARLAGQQDVDAEVVAFLPEGRSPEDVVARERVLFEQRTGITTIVLHEMGQYPKLLRWIEDYRRERARGRPRRGAPHRDCPPREAHPQSAPENSRRTAAPAAPPGGGRAVAGRGPAPRSAPATSGIL